MTIIGNYEMNEINQDNDHGTMEIEMGINHCISMFFYFIIILNYYFFYSDSYPFHTLIIFGNKENEYNDQGTIPQNYNKEQNITLGSYNLSTCFPCYLMILLIFTIQNIITIGI